MKAIAILLLAACSLVAAPHRTTRRHGGVVSTAKEAKAIAEQETGGTAVSARRIPLNAASGGWEVDVHMPKDERGWRCIIDNDTHMLRSKEKIANPQKTKGHR